MHFSFRAEYSTLACSQHIDKIRVYTKFLLKEEASLMRVQRRTDL